MVKVLLLSNALAQLYNLICIQIAKYEIRIFMNIDKKKNKRFIRNLRIE